MGKSFLTQRIYEQLSGEGFKVALIEPSSPKLILVEIANLLEISTKNLEGRSLSADALKAAIAQYLSCNTGILIFDDAHLLEAKFRLWLKQLKKVGCPMLLTATNPPRTDIFINVPRIELQPLPDYAIRELMEQEALNRGINLRPTEFARLQERTGGNPLLAQRAIEEELLGIDLEAGDHTRYFDITPLIMLVAIVFISMRFIALGTNNQSLYIIMGIGGTISIGFFRAFQSLPKESRRIQ